MIYVQWCIKVPTVLSFFLLLLLFYRLLSTWWLYTIERERDCGVFVHRSSDALNIMNACGSKTAMRSASVCSLERRCAINNPQYWFNEQLKWWRLLVAASFFFKRLWGTQRWCVTTKMLEYYNNFDPSAFAQKVRTICEQFADSNRNTANKPVCSKCAIVQTEQLSVSSGRRNASVEHFVVDDVVVVAFSPPQNLCACAYGCAGLLGPKHRAHVHLFDKTCLAHNGYIVCGLNMCKVSFRRCVNDAKHTICELMRKGYRWAMRKEKKRVTVNLLWIQNAREDRD